MGREEPGQGESPSFVLVCRPRGVWLRQGGASFAVATSSSITPASDIVTGSTGILEFVGQAVGGGGDVDDMGGNDIVVGGCTTSVKNVAGTILY